MSLASCRIVLVRPQFPANIGAAARLMRNFGLEWLTLVAPACDHTDQAARRLSTHGEEILHRATVAATLGEGVSDCVFVAGASARMGGLFRRQAFGTPRQTAPEIAAVLRQGHKAALVFGPERTGLTNDEITLCHQVMRIPASEEYPALNLAQAVAICVYEVYLASQEAAGTPAQTSVPDAAPFASQQLMFAQLEAALRRIHFLYGEKADSLMHALRHLLGKARLTTTEVRILQGLARQIDWGQG